MRKKELRLIISFHTTAEAMATEQLCRRYEMEGKLVSVPRSITSDCGLAWSAPVALRETLRQLLEEHAVEYAGLHEVLI